MKSIWLSKFLPTVLVTAVSISTIPTISIRAENFSSVKAQNTNDLRLWYTRPPSEVPKEELTLGAGGFSPTDANNYWQQLTLPIGNGFIGANVYGEIEDEHLTFNEKTLWNGGPSTHRPDYMGGNLEEKGKNGETMKEIQQLFAEGKDAEASALCDQLVGFYVDGNYNTSDGYGAYQAWGDIYFDFNLDKTKASSYVRDLDLKTAIASVNFDCDGVNYNREYFISYPDNVLAIKFTASQANKLNFDVRFPSKHGATPVANGNNLTVAGQLQDNQMKFNSQLKVINEGGNIVANGDKLTVSDANSVVVFVAASTDYKNDYPTYRTGETDEELNQKVAGLIDSATQKGYDVVKNNHLSDYQNIFSRVEFDLGQAPSTVPTDKLLKNYKSNKASDEEARDLEVMTFQYGRYLTIASSREGTLPANLQGVWNDRIGNWMAIPWSSDYHMNVNLQMNYWPTYSTNMAECAIPLIEYVNSLREPGRVTAEIYAGVKSDTNNPENGFMAHTQNNPFGWTCPGWEFNWGWSPAAVPWILQNCWEYYEYTGDIDYMRDNIYPMLKEEATLYDNMLVEDKSTGRIISSPTYSPEHGPRTNGNAYEQELIWQLYEDTIKAAEILGVDADKVTKWKDTQSKLKPIEIGDSGQIKEWYNETTLGSIGDSGHRHMSHLLGLYPGDLISVDTPKWMEAAIISLKNRGDDSTGWGMGQRLNSWARTGDGEHAYQIIKNFFAKGAYPNLWDAHPPFQIDGNFGITAGISEMLLQSNMDYINILPAIPSKWSNGSVRGLIARGNFEIGMDWANSSPTNILIKSNNGEKCTVNSYNIKNAKVTKSDGTVVKNIEVISDDRISFDTQKGETYTITDMEQRPEPPKEAELITGLSVKALNSDGTEVADELSEEGSNGAISLAVDGDTSTYWHSNWSTNNNLKLPATIVIDMNKKCDSERFDYVPRDGGSQNGRIKEATLYYTSEAINNIGNLDSINNVNWTEVEHVNWANDGNTKIITIPENTKAQYIKLVVDHTYGDTDDTFIAASEFMPFGYTHNIKVESINATNSEGSPVIDQGGTPVDNIIDGNVETVWHTAWAVENKVKFPATITMDLGKVYNLDKFDYLPRSSNDGVNGIIAKANFSYSLDATNWSEPIDVEWDKNNDIKTYTFPEKVFARYIKLTVKSTYGATDEDIDRYITGREFIVYKGVETLEPEQPETDLESAIKQSQEILNKDAKAEEVIQAIRILSDAIIKYSKGN